MFVPIATTLQLSIVSAGMSFPLWNPIYEINTNAFFYYSEQKRAARLKRESSTSNSTVHFQRVSSTVLSTLELHYITTKHMFFVQQTNVVKQNRYMQKKE